MHLKPVQAVLPQRLWVRKHEERSAQVGPHDREVGGHGIRPAAEVDVVREVNLPKVPELLRLVQLEYRRAPERVQVHVLLLEPVVPVERVLVLAEGVQRGLLVEVAQDGVVAVLEGLRQGRNLEVRLARYVAEDDALVPAFQGHIQDCRVYFPRHFSQHVEAPHHKRKVGPFDRILHNIDRYISRETHKREKEIPNQNNEAHFKNRGS
mmetsp:Transcript_5667/g.8599  ORF Transcript_5667/g.8599 Transcript_5667/m.8599 type:complete len:208 (-) Transcript_5667:3064-3687(-)